MVASLRSYTSCFRFFLVVLFTRFPRVILRASAVRCRLCEYRSASVSPLNHHSLTCARFLDASLLSTSATNLIVKTLHSTCLPVNTGHFSFHYSWHHLKVPYYVHPLRSIGVDILLAIFQYRTVGILFQWFILSDRDCIFHACFVAVGSAAIPVSDIRGVDSLNYSKQEKIIRNKTASLYRLADIFAMGNSLITVSVSTLLHSCLASLACDPCQS